MNEEPFLSKSKDRVWMVSASVAISMGVACPSAHKKDKMRRVTYQHGRGRREATEDKWTPMKKGKADKRKRRMWSGFGIGVGEALGRLGG